MVLQYPIVYLFKGLNIQQRTRKDWLFLLEKESKDGDSDITHLQNFRHYLMLYERVKGRTQILSRQSLEDSQTGVLEFIVQNMKEIHWISQF